MKKVTFSSIKRAYETYRNATATSLRDVYSSFSGAKESAYDYCCELFRKYDGERFRIIGANTFGFSVGFLADIDGKISFVYITKDYDRYAPIPD